jgi:hypothetical protein
MRVLIPLGVVTAFVVGLIIFRNWDTARDGVDRNIVHPPATPTKSSTFTNGDEFDLETIRAVCPPEPAKYRNAGIVYRCHYDAIQSGMTADQVRSIIGFDGEEQASSSNSRILRWEDQPNMGRSIMSVTFSRAPNGSWVVSSKSQVELRNRPSAKQRAQWAREAAERKAATACLMKAQTLEDMNACDKTRK